MKYVVLVVAILAGGCRGSNKGGSTMLAGLGIIGAGAAVSAIAHSQEEENANQVGPPVSAVPLLIGLVAGTITLGVGMVQAGSHAAAEAEAKKPPPPPPLPPPPPVARRAERDEPVVPEVTEVAPSSSPAVRQMHRAAKQLAKDDRCKQVQDFGVRIARHDARYHAAVFVRDGDIAECLRKTP